MMCYALPNQLSAFWRDFRTVAEFNSKCVKDDLGGALAGPHSSTFYLPRPHHLLDRYYFGCGYVAALRNGWDDAVSFEANNTKVPRLQLGEKVRAMLDMDKGELTFALFGNDSYREVPGKLTGITGPVVAACCLQNRSDNVTISETSRVREYAVSVPEPFLQPDFTRAKQLEKILDRPAIANTNTNLGNSDSRVPPYTLSSSARSSRGQDQRLVSVRGMRDERDATDAKGTRESRDIRETTDAASRRRLLSILTQHQASSRYGHALY